MKSLGKILSAALLTVSATAALAQQEANKLRWASTPAITAPDPYYNFHREAMLLNGQLVWDTLVYRNPADGSYEPLLATEWEWKDDTTLQFKLRQDVKFHNGKPLTSADVVYTYNYIVNPDNKINVQSNVNWIDRAEAQDDYTVTLHLKAPFPPALEYVSTLHAILPEGFYGEAQAANVDGGLIGTGPYVFAEFVPGSSMKVTKFNGYFADSPKGLPKLDEIEFRTIPEASTQLAELMSGGVDWIWYVPSDQAAPLARREGLLVDPAETMRITFLSYNMREMEGGNPLTDKRVREAIAYAIDRETIVSRIVGAGSSAIDAPCFRTQFGCRDDLTKRGYDPEKAKALLAEAGWDGSVTLSMVGNASRDRAWIEAVAGYLAAVGINTDVQLLQWAALQERVAGNTVHLSMADWGSYGVNDVSALLNNFFTLTPDDMARDQELSDALIAATKTVDQDARKKSYDFAVSRIVDELYWQPMWTNPATYAYDADLEFTPFPDENPRFFLVGWND